ncbi:MAG: hypothetical protein Q3Y08_07000, partial [Butyricicoccus sp.]|nr:hypothetical protein [Butyricicoccus sp.]
RQRYFLQRVEPYPISYGYFDSADDIVTFIKKDLEKFKNAQKSHHFKQFLEISKVFHQSSLELEQLFLERNVSHAAMDGLETSAKDLLNTLQQAYATCPKIE